MDERKENLEKMPDLRRLLHLPAAGPYHHRDRERGGGETRVPGIGNGFRIFFRLGQIDGNINVAVFGMYFPFLIFAYPIAANVVAVLT